MHLCAIGNRATHARSRSLGLKRSAFLSTAANPGRWHIFFSGQQVSLCFSICPSVCLCSGSPQGGVGGVGWVAHPLRRHPNSATLHAQRKP